MMAAGLTSGALFLVVLIGTSYSLPVKSGGDQGSSGGGDSANPGYGYQVPSGGYGSVSGYQPASHPAAVAPSSSYYPAPHPQYPAPPQQYPVGFIQGPVEQPSVPSATQALVYPWLVQPVGALPVETSSSLGASTGLDGADQSGASSSSGFFPGFQSYQGGELSHVEKTFEQGNSDSESETEGSPRRPGGPGVFSQPGPHALPDASAFPASYGPGVFRPPGGLGYGLPWYPYYDYQFVTGQYPPGTITHFRSSYEQGRDSFHDNHYVRDLPIHGHPQVPVYPPVHPPVKQQRQ